MVWKKSEAFMKSHRDITKSAWQAPSSHRDEAQLIEFLHKAVVGYAEAEKRIIRIATYCLSFQ